MQALKGMEQFGLQRGVVAHTVITNFQHHMVRLVAMLGTHVNGNARQVHRLGELNCVVQHMAEGLTQ